MKRSDRSPFDLTSNPAHSAYWKVRQARTSLAALSKEIRETRVVSHHGVSFIPDFATGEFLVTLVEAQYRKGWGINKPRDAVRPERWAVVVGEVIHDLRSALDHLAFQLSASVQSILYERLDHAQRLPRAWRKIAFPIFLTRGEYEKYGVPKLWCLDSSRRFMDFIESQQPFARHVDAHKESLLWTLNGLWNIDKHRTLNVLGALVRLSTIQFESDVEVIEAEYGEWQPYEAPARIGRFRLNTPLPENLLSDYELGFDISLREGVLSGPRSLIDTLEVLIEEVTRVLDEFQDLYYET